MLLVLLWSQALSVVRHKRYVVVVSLVRMGPICARCVSRYREGYTVVLTNGPAVSLPCWASPSALLWHTGRAGKRAFVLEGAALFDHSTTQTWTPK